VLEVGTNGQAGAGSDVNLHKRIGPEFAAITLVEGLFRHFENRRQMRVCGSGPDPWKSGAVDREQGVYKKQAPPMRNTMIQLAWLWAAAISRAQLSASGHERVSATGAAARQRSRTGAKDKVALEIRDSRCRYRKALR